MRAWDKSYVQTLPLCICELIFCSCLTQFFGYILQALFTLKATQTINYEVLEWEGIAGIYSSVKKSVNNAPEWPIETTTHFPTPNLTN